MSIATPLDTASRLELLELYARYTHAFDGGQVDELTALFAEDGTFVREGAEPVRGRAALATMAQAAAASGITRHHVVSSILIESESESEAGDADRARGTAYVTVLTLHDDAVRLLATGVYRDTFARVAHRWLILERRFAPMTHAGLAGCPVVTAIKDDDASRSAP